MTAYETLTAVLPAPPKTWVTAGVTGFIGSNPLKTWPELDQRVVGLDNFATGHRHNLDELGVPVSTGECSLAVWIDRSSGFGYRHV